MGWLMKERRGPPWKVGWTEQAIASITPPPSPLLAILGIMAVLLWLSSYSNYKAQMERSMLSFKLLLFLLSLLFVFLAHSITRYGRLVFLPPRTKTDHFREDTTGAASPWGVVLVLSLLLVLVSYQSYFHSKWSPLVSRKSY